MELLRRFRTVHFRDYMALQLTPFLGTTAFQDRMGDTFPHLVAEGRLIQGHPTSGPLDADMEGAVNQDLVDPVWRNLFHHSFREYRRFQRGLFDPSHGIAIGRTIVPGPAALLQLMDPVRATSPVTVESVRKLSARQTLFSPAPPGARRDAPSPMSESYDFEYGLALIKTAVSNLWTVRIGSSRNLTVATESIGHYDLLRQTLHRSGVNLTNYLLAKTDYPAPS
ncbi:MAG: hypothetical protein ACREIM_04010 [Nitrospiraceae bacterium]